MEPLRVDLMDNSERPVPWLEMLSAGSRVGAELPEKIPTATLHRATDPPLPCVKSAYPS